MWTEQFASWTNAADSERVEGAQRLIAQRAKALAQSRKLWDQFVYLNGKLRYICRVRSGCEGWMLMFLVE